HNGVPYCFLPYLSFLFIRRENPEKYYPFTEKKLCSSQIIDYQALPGKQIGEIYRFVFQEHIDYQADKYCNL
ncbi:MAG: hypothetical protein IJ222_07755, partial [Bacteroidales bacterium]|nr:hypothetical protein [Bacteroidales bacterium]